MVNQTKLFQWKPVTEAATSNRTITDTAILAASLFMTLVILVGIGYVTITHYATLSTPDWLGLALITLLTCAVGAMGAFFSKRP